MHTHTNTYTFLGYVSVHAIQADAISKGTLLKFQINKFGIAPIKNSANRNEKDLKKLCSAFIGLVRKVSSDLFSNIKFKPLIVTGLLNTLIIVSF